MMIRLILLAALMAFFPVGHLQALPVKKAPVKTLPPVFSDVSLSVKSDGCSASVAIPTGATKLLIEHRSRAGKWVAWRAIALKEGRATSDFRLPARAVLADWRAKVQLPGTLKPTSRKYPDAFYKGAKVFKATPSTNYTELPESANNLAPVGSATLVSASVADVSKSASPAPVAEAVEADIWKTAGTTVFFFNQLRGLQVIDLADPSNPSLVTTLRLPAVGQDLYIPAAEGGMQFAVLLTRDPENWCSTVVNLVRIAEGKAEITAVEKIAGWLTDSRMAGNKLFLGTQNWSGASESALLQEITLDPATGTLTRTADFQVGGNSPVFSAGAGWLTVATSDWSDWSHSQVSLFSFDENGLKPITASPIKTAGRIYDKFKTQFKDGVFTAISQGNISDASNGWVWWGTPVTVLENFSTDGTLLASLELIRGEQLYATRFAGDKAYAVTFRQKDPLWVLDLKDAANPVISGHLEIPGWSTYIEPIGDLLFTIGWEENKVAASLFDVADPANPTLASRLFLSDTWGYSEALYDEKALKVLPEEHLALIPFSGISTDATATEHLIQLVDWDPATKTLSKRGAIHHDFEPRRAAMVGDALASLSQRQLVTAAITNRDQPTILADLLLAWPVNRLLAKDSYLLEIADGSCWWDNSQAAIRVATLQDPDSVLAETLLGAGTVRDAALLGDELCVLRVQGMNQNIWWRPMPLLRIAATGETATEAVLPTLSLDVYDASKLPELTLLHSSSLALPGDYSSWDTSRLLLPLEKSAVVLAQPCPVLHWLWVGYSDVSVPIAGEPSSTLSGLTKASSMMVDPSYGRYNVIEPTSARAAVFDWSGGDSTAKLVALSDNTTIALKTATAAQGLVVFGSSAQPAKGVSNRTHLLGILDVQNPSVPTLRPAMDLPGRLLAVTDLTRDGFLAWTEGLDAAGAFSQVHVSACDMADVFKITSLAQDNISSVAASGRSLLVASPNTLRCYTLDDSASLIPAEKLTLDWTPANLSIAEGKAFASDYSHVSQTPLTSFPDGQIQWDTDRSLDMEQILPLSTGVLLVPAGDYGVDVFSL